MLEWTDKARTAVREVGETIVERGKGAIDAIGDRFERNGRGRYAEKSKAELYEMARERGIPGRSGMSKDQLVRALRR